MAVLFILVRKPWNQGPHRSFSKLTPEGESTQYAPYLDIGDFSQLLPGRK
jgi:hypothetical protein